MQADSDALQRSAGSQPMGLPIGYGFTHDFALCRSAGAVRQFHRLRHAFSVQMVWYLSLTYGQAHRLSSGTPSACFSQLSSVKQNPPVRQASLRSCLSRHSFSDGGSRPTRRGALHPLIPFGVANKSLRAANKRSAVGRHYRNTPLGCCF